LLLSETLPLWKDCNHRCLCCHFYCPPKLLYLHRLPGTFGHCCLKLFGILGLWKCDTHRYLCYHFYYLPTPLYLHRLPGTFGHCCLKLFGILDLWELFPGVTGDMWGRLSNSTMKEDILKRKVLSEDPKKRYLFQKSTVSYGY
jgi:hypothetical protein